MRPFGIGAALGIAVGGLLAFLFDPQSGKRRRHGAVDRTAGMLRRRVRATGSRRSSWRATCARTSSCST